MRSSLTPFSRGYAVLRHKLAPLGPHLARLTWLRALVGRLDRRVMPGEEVLVTTAAGWDMWLDPADQAVARCIIATGEWQPAEADLIRTLVREGDTAIDVGANVGYMTGVLASAVGASGRVIAFEPEQRNHGLVERTVAFNAWSQVSLHRAACGESAGKLTLHRDGHNFGNHSLARDTIHTAATQVVDVVTLDESTASLDELALIKLDVQGWEWHVLRGAQTLKRFSPVLVTEFFPRGLRLAGVDPHELWAELESWGDVLCVSPNGRVVPITFEEARGGDSDEWRNVDLVVRPPA